MKKLSILIVVIALAMFAVFFSASAQETGLPAIDETEAEPYLGTWNSEKICFTDNDCIDIASMGVRSVMTFNTDNTAVLSEAGEPDRTSHWYMENGSAYFVTSGENDSVTNNPMRIDENGDLVIDMTDLSAYYSREAAPIPGTAELKADAVIDDFLGEWFLQGVLTDTGMLPGFMLGMTGTITISENGITYVLVDKMIGQDVPFELKDGKITAVFETQDEKGNAVTNTAIFEYHADNTVLMSNEGDNSGYMVFVPQEAYTSVSAEVENQGADLDLSSLLSNLDLNALLQNEKIQQLMNDPQVAGLLNGIKDENGNINLDNLVNGLGGLFGSNAENGQGGTKLDGLLEGLGGLFGGGK